MSTEENKAVVRLFFEAKTIDDYLALVDKYMTPDFVQRDPSGDMPLEIFKQYNIAMANAFPDFSFTVDDQVAEGDMVVTRYTMKGTHKGEFSGIPPTGKSFSITGVDVSRIVNGKFVEGWGYADRLGLMQQLGAIPSQ